MSWKKVVIINIYAESQVVQTFFSSMS